MSKGILIKPDCFFECEIKDGNVIYGAGQLTLEEAKAKGLFFIPSEKEEKEEKVEKKKTRK